MLSSWKERQNRANSLPFKEWLRPRKPAPQCQGPEALALERGKT